MCTRIHSGDHENKQAGLGLAKGKPPVEVSKRGDNEPQQLLRTRLSERNFAPGELSALSSRLEHLPLALAQAAAFIEANTTAVGDYLLLLDKSDQDLVTLLSEEFEAVGRDWKMPRAVAETWILSFEQIQEQYPFAGELLSLMSFFDRQAIPLEFLACYGEHYGAERCSGILVEKALGVLKAFSFVTVGEDQSFEYHRLVRLVTRKWLARNDRVGYFTGQALMVVSDAFLESDNMAQLDAYLPHALAVSELDGRGSSVTDLKKSKALLFLSMGEHNYLQGRWADAEQHLSESITLAKEVDGEESSFTLYNLGYLARVIEARGRSEEAELLGKKVLEVCRRVLGDGDLSTLSIMGTMVAIYHARGRLEEAELLGTQALEAARGGLGEEHSVILGTSGELASIYAKRGRLEEAESLGMQALETNKRLLGEEATSTLSSMDILSGIYAARGRLGEAESLGMQVLEASRRVQGEEHPLTLQCTHNLAVVWWDQGRHTEALASMQQCVDLYRKVLGPDHPDTLRSVSLLQEWQLASDHT